MQDKVLVFPEPSPGDKAQLVTPDLPVSLTSLIGREQEVQALHALLLRPDVRLLTLTGTPGVGKTRLALEVARELVHDFADGVHLVSLAPISDPAFVIPTIARRLGLIESGSQPLLDLLKTSQHDKHRLLLLDNFEQVIPAATLLAELLEACPDLKLLVTSREVLRLRGEHQFAVLPLALPDPKRLPDDRSLAHVPAVDLFLQRAQAITADFHLTTDNAAAIAEICLRLDGLPLAIELAAARSKLLAPQALLARLDRRLPILTGGARDLAERQRSLRNTLAWSYELLTAQEQRLFQRISVFVGGATLEAVEAICAALDDGEVAALDGVASLTDKSLLQQLDQEGNESRLLMLETIREYSWEGLTASGEGEATRQTHAEYYLALAEEAEPHLRGAQQLLWLRRLDREQGNLRAALGWLIAYEEVEKALRFCGALWWFWNIEGYWSEGWRWLEAALKLPGGQRRTAERAKALYGAAVLTYYLGHPEADSFALLEESVSISRELMDKERLAVSPDTLSWSMSTSTPQGVVTVQRHLEESLALAREVGDPWTHVNALRTVGNIMHYHGDLASERHFFEASVKSYRELNNTRALSRRLLELIYVVESEGQVMQGAVLARESLALARTLDNRPEMARALYTLAMLESLQGQNEQAVTLFEECLLLAREQGDKAYIGLILLTLGGLVLHLEDVLQAEIYAQESLTLSREPGNKFRTALVLSLLGDIRRKQGNLAQARATCKEGMRVARNVGNRYGMGKNLVSLAMVAAEERHPGEAARLFGAAEAWLNLKVDMRPFEHIEYEHVVESVRTQLGEEAWMAAWTEGQAITPEHLLADEDPLPKPALAASSASATVPQTRLTPREIDILRLLAQGLTSAQIAEQLVIGLVTVNSHVRSIYSKLGITSRAAATRYALEHHLL